MTQKQFLEKFSLFNPKLEVWINNNFSGCLLSEFINNVKIANTPHLNINLFDNCIYTPTKIICYTKR